MTVEHELQDEKARMAMRIDGMHCASCVATIENSLADEDGVIKATVSLLDEKAVIEYVPSKISSQQLEKVVDSTGYRAKRLAMTLTVSGPLTESDFRIMEDKLSELEGTITVRTFPDTRRLLIAYDEDLVTYKMIKETLRNQGFDLEDAEGIEGDRESLARERERRFYSGLFVFSLLLAIPVVLLHFQVLNALIPSEEARMLLMFVLSTPVQFIGGYPFYKSALRSAVHFKTNMDTLVMLGTSAAYFYSVATTFFLTGFSSVYDTAVLLITFIFLGRTLEAIAK